MKMIEVKTADLVGAALDWAVAKSTDFSVQVKPWGEFSNASTGHKIKARGFRVWYEFDGDLEEWTPSADWAQGGPLIESNQIELGWNGIDGKSMWWMARHQELAAQQIGDTPLIAAMRAIVSSKIGDTVSVPAELVTSSTH